MTRQEIRTLLVAGRVASDDSDAAARDGFRKRRKQQLGHALRVKNYTDGRDSLVHTLDTLITYFSDPEPGDAPRVH